MRAAAGLAYMGIGLGVALFASHAGAQAAPTWPADSAWVALEQGGVKLGDPLNDAAGRNVLDIVGDASNPAAYVYRDATFIYFRLRLDGNPQNTPSDYASFAWGVQFDTGTTDAYEYLAMVNGVADMVQLWSNTTPGAVGDPKDRAELEIASYPVTTHARSVPAGSNFGGDPDYFIDWAVNIPDLESAGLNLNEPIRFIFGTSTDKQSITTDFLSPTSESTIDKLGSDPVDCEGTTCRPPGCTNDTDCADPTRPVCQTSTGACVECSTANSTRCGQGEVCNDSSGTCGASCNSDADCGGAQPACQPSGACGECSASNRALCTGARTRCDENRGICTSETTGAGGSGSGGSTGTAGDANLTADDISLTGSGCACEAPARPASAGMLGVLGLAALGGLARRRRRSR